MFEQFRNKFPVSDKQWKDFTKRIKRIEIPAKTILLNEGEVSKTAYFIEKGCLRVWFNNDGKDVSCQFFFEGENVSSIESLKTNQPSLLTIETIEPSVVHCISKEDYLYILEASPAIKKYAEEQIFKRMIYYQHLFLSRIKDTPQQRYMDLIKEKPEIVKRVPQHYIASYLGVTKVHLSRIKSKIAKQKN